MIEWLHDLNGDGETYHTDLPPYLVYVYAAVSAVLVLVAGSASGLTLALLSISQVDLEVRGSVVKRPPDVSCTTPVTWHGSPAPHPAGAQAQWQRPGEALRSAHHAGEFSAAAGLPFTGAP